jgi:hypothetical protein
MTAITIAEIARFRSELADNPDAIIALDTIEDCEGDLEDAAIVLAIRDGLEPDQANSRWLEGLARQCRGILCQAEFQPDIKKGFLKPAVEHLKTTGFVPVKQVFLVVIYAWKIGIDDFCSI